MGPVTAQTASIEVQFCIS